MVESRVCEEQKRWFFSKPLPPLISVTPCFVEFSIDGSEFCLTLCGWRGAAPELPDEVLWQPERLSTLSVRSPKRGIDCKAKNGFH